MGIGAILGGVTGAIGAISSSKAAKSQQSAANRQFGLEERIYEETVDRFQPFLDSGLNAQNALAFELGLGERPTFGGTAPEIVEFQDPVEGAGGPRRRLRDIQYQNGVFNPAAANTPRNVTKFRVGEQVFNSRDAAQEYADANPTGGFEYEGFKATPSYDFRRSEGLNAIDNSAASRGNLFSGATLKATQTFGDNLASNEYGNFLARLTGVAGQGQAAAGNAANAGSNFAAGAGNALAAYSNAGSAGAIGVGSAINSGINNAYGIWNYQNQINGGGTPFNPGALY